jgi:hypothetical protein
MELMSIHTVIFKLIEHLNRLSHTTWDIIDSIRLCLHRGLDIFHTDSCRCACSFNDCHTSSGFNITFKREILAKVSRASFVWVFEWVSIVEEFHGYEAAKTVCLSFIRRMRFDLLKIAHVCCHKGKGIGPKGPIGSRKVIGDVRNPLDVEEGTIRGWRKRCKGIPEKAWRHSNVFGFSYSKKCVTRLLKSTGKI